MIKRVDKFLVIITDNLMAMEVITQWIYGTIGGQPYFIEIEKFPKMTLYRICIEVTRDWDKKITSLITEDLEARHIKLMGEELT